MNMIEEFAKLLLDPRVLYKDLEERSRFLV